MTTHIKQQSPFLSPSSSFFSIALSKSDIPYLYLFNTYPLPPEHELCEGRDLVLFPVESLAHSPMPGAQ